MFRGVGIKGAPSQRVSSLCVGCRDIAATSAIETFRRRITMGWLPLLGSSHTDMFRRCRMLIGFRVRV